jgi:competence protein ComEC
VAALRGVAELTARLPFARLTAPSPSPVAWLACAAAAYGLYMALTAPRRPLAKRYAVATALCVVTAIAAWSFRGPPRDEAVFLDVGHGDATFIATAHGERLLIDGGARQPDYDAGARIVGPFLRSRGVAKLDYVIATHADNDHIGGLISVVESYNVQAAILGPDSGRPLEREFITACRRRGVPVHRVRAGDRLALGGVRAEVLHPPRGWTGGSVNDASVVLRLDWPDRELPALLLPGDIELEAESTLAKRIEPAPLLKVPHHGSKTSSSPAFLSAVAPKIGVVSTGGSRGREAVDPVVMARYAEMGALVWRTDVEGGLTLRALGGKGVLRGERRRRGYPAPKRPTTAGAAVDNL